MDTHQPVINDVIRRLFSLFLLLGSLSLPAVAYASALAEMQAFSAIQGVDLEKLASGKVLMSRAGKMSFPRGLALESCYLVPLPLEKTADLHQQWNAARHPELKVYMHRSLGAKSFAADFADAFGSVRDNPAVRSLVAATEKLRAGASELQLGETEVKPFGKDGSGAAKGPFPGPVAAFWSHLLAQRVSAYAKGGVSQQPAYELSGNPVRVTDEITRLLKEQPKWRDQFKPLWEEAGLTSARGNLTPALYSELIDVEGRAAFILGAFYAKPLKGGWQALDVKYYGSDGFLTMLTIYQFWPVTTASGKQATLVWRGDLVSSAALAELRGVERLGSAGAMMKEIQKNIDFLQRDAAGKR